jgi:hypothetical protein
MSFQSRLLTDGLLKPLHLLQILPALATLVRENNGMVFLVFGQRRDKSVPSDKFQ